MKPILILLGISLTLTAALGGSSGVHAAGVRYAAASPQGSGNCSSWANACTLQTALAGAVSGDQVWVKAGVHKPTANPADRTASFVLKNGVAVYGGFQGAETSLEQRNWQVNRTVLSGDIDNNDNDPNGDGVIANVADIVGANSYHVVTGSGTNATAVLDGFIITAGQANGASSSAYGGGIYNYAGSPTAANLILSANTATSGGGGMYNNNSSPSLTNVSFLNNRTTASSSYGGGMANENNSSPTLNRVTYNGNAAVFRGGGMYNATGDPELREVTFVGNTASQGGGMLNDASFPQLTAVTFSNNGADNGGGMYNRNGSLPRLTNVTFSGNTATNTGGGMVNVGTHPVLTNVTFTGNVATNNGGGIYNNSGANPALTNVIMWGNSAASGAQIFNTASSTATIANSDIQGCGGSGGGWSTACGTDGGANIDADPRLGPLTNNGGATLTHALLPVSAAVDLGDNSACPATDQRGVSRPQLANCDMGAVEYVPPPRLYVDDTAVGQNTGLSWADALLSLQDALLAAGNGVEIWVAAGVYYPDEGVKQTNNNRAHSFNLRNGIALYGGFAGSETLLSQRDWLSNITILSGDIDKNDINTDGNFIAETSAHIQGANSYHVVYGGSTNNTAVLDGFVITAGQANGSAFPAQEGGGFFGLTASPTLANLLFSGNMATAVGGGLYSKASSNSFVLTDITFRGNSATQGGGMGAVTSDFLVLRNVIFVDNTATRGAGMYNDSSNPVLRGVTFSNNHADGDGGGMYNRNNSLPILVNVVFSGNSASDDGGGMVNVGAMPVLNNVTFSGNSAVNTGGGIVNRSNALPTLANVILWGNNATQGPQIFNDSSANAAISYSDIQGCGGSANWNIACGTNGPGNVDVNPLFVDADGADNIVGTADDNLHLQATSPVIDAGWNQVVAAVTTDRDGNPRFVDIPTVPDTGNGAPPIVDMGAYETQLEKWFIFLPLILR